MELRESHRYEVQVPYQWQVVQVPMSVGDVVSIHNGNQPRGFWNLGRIEETLTGPDGEIRGAVLQVSGQGGKMTLLHHLVQQLYPCEVPTQPIELSDSHQRMVITPEPRDVTRCPDRNGLGDANSEFPKLPRCSTHATAFRAKDKLMAQMLSEDS